MSSESLHEPVESLRSETIDRHRAISSLMEEMEAVDWYDQRVDAIQNPELRGILAHNRDEEKEHATMVIEWLRRNDAVLDAEMQTYLFSTGSILGAESDPAAATPESTDAATGGDSARAGSLSIGSLKPAMRGTAQ